MVAAPGYGQGAAAAYCDFAFIAVAWRSFGRVAPKAAAGQEAGIQMGRYARTIHRAVGAAAGQSLTATVDAGSCSDCRPAGRRVKAPAQAGTQAAGQTVTRGATAGDRP